MCEHVKKKIFYDVDFHSNSQTLKVSKTVGNLDIYYNVS